MTKSASDVLKLAKDQKAKMVDLKFMDFIGTWQHFQIPIGQLSEATFDDGVYFDGSSIRAWQGIENSDMSVVPDPTTAKIDPFFQESTLSLICDIRDPVTGEDYSRDPRHVAKKAINYMRSSGVADTAYFGPEAEFFIFDSVSYDTHSGAGYYFLDSQEAPWTTGEPSGNMGYKVKPKQGYFPTAPVDSMQDMRGEIVLMLEAMGLEVEASHHEVAPAQHEIDFRFDTLVKTADNLQWYKYIVKNIARKYDRVATFMPKPMFNDNGSGMHCHQSLWKGGEPLFAGDKYAGLSEMALHYIGGILKHAQALAAFVCPSTNSYRRLLPGLVRFPDSTCNAYLGFTAMLMAGLDGIENKIDPGEPLDKDIYGLPPEELAKVPKVPSSLRDALTALEKDHAFMLKGDVFTEDVIRYWIDYKIESEIGEVDSRPSPHEFYLYFDA
jgi:glutamine synthetase